MVPLPSIGSSPPPKDGGGCSEGGKASGERDLQGSIGAIIGTTETGNTGTEEVILGRGISKTVNSNGLLIIPPLDTTKA